jgi:hypothetical protein
MKIVEVMKKLGTRLAQGCQSSDLDIKIQLQTTRTRPSRGVTTRINESGNAYIMTNEVEVALAGTSRQDSDFDILIWSIRVGDSPGLGRPFHER